ncbi:cytochrome c biogenesis heme-transporting ATPase CcmA [Ampullimonas aquatilis]|uniref:cytochrome c biogenesis heme-transporting ATPase CcmA n=1 Tax=Ampullimonas aquatilis TaxID=1341549 RepID=UPI003C7102AE
MLLEAIQLACSYSDIPLFENINLKIGPGEALRVCGENGSGKTSLLRILCGLTKPIEGIVKWNGQDIRDANYEFNQGLIYIGHANALKGDLTACENILFGSALTGDVVSIKEAYRVLHLVGLSTVADYPIKILSQGQCKRVAQAKLRLPEMRSLWILDEPFTALDKRAVTDLIDVMNNHLKNGGMLIYTTHQEIELIAQHSLVLNIDSASIC